MDAYDTGSKVLEREIYYGKCINKKIVNLWKSTKVNIESKHFSY